MKFILVLVCSILLPILSFRPLSGNNKPVQLSTLQMKTEKKYRELVPKLCIHCKHLITDNEGDQFAKCALFPRITINNDYLVTGVKEEEKPSDYHYCSVARNMEHMCGLEGNLHEKKRKKTT